MYMRNIFTQQTYVKCTLYVYLHAHCQYYARLLHHGCCTPAWPAKCNNASGAHANQKPFMQHSPPPFRRHTNFAKMLICQSIKKIFAYTLLHLFGCQLKICSPYSHRVVYTSYTLSSYIQVAYIRILNIRVVAYVYVEFCVFIKVHCVRGLG